VKIGPNSPNTKLPPLPPSTFQLTVSQVLITLSGLGSQLGALPPTEELELDELSSDELEELSAAELATELAEVLSAAELATELTAAELATELTAAELATELTAAELATELTAAELATELTAAELATELTAAELATELTAAELALELTATELELELASFFLLSLPPQAVKRTLTVSATAKCFTIAISPTDICTTIPNEGGVVVARIVYLHY